MISFGVGVAGDDNHNVPQACFPSRAVRFHCSENKLEPMVGADGDKEEWICALDHSIKICMYI